jgi:hypothetical protein
LATAVSLAKVKYHSTASLASIFVRACSKILSSATSAAIGPHTRFPASVAA